MDIGAALIAVIVYLVIAGLSGSAAQAKHIDRDGVTIFSVQKYVRILIWFGGLICVLIGAHGILFHDQPVSSLIFLLFGLLCPFIPLKAVATSRSGLKAIGIFPWRSTSIPWNEIERVEWWRGARMISVVGSKAVVTHTRFHVGKAEFIHELELHVSKDKWKMREHV